MLPICLQSIQDGIESSGMLSDTSRAAYWSYHLSRSAFFMVQGLSGACSRLFYASTLLIF